MTHGSCSSQPLRSMYFRIGRDLKVISPGISDRTPPLWVLNLCAHQTGLLTVNPWQSSLPPGQSLEENHCFSLCSLPPPRPAPAEAFSKYSPHTHPHSLSWEPHHSIWPGAGSYVPLTCRTPTDSQEDRQLPRPALTPGNQWKSYHFPVEIGPGHWAP